MSKLRFDAIEAAFKKRAAEYPIPEGRPSEYFGELVFNRQKMQKYLDAKTLHALLDCIDNGKPALQPLVPAFDRVDGREA